MTALRKPLLYLLVLACAASLAAGGRVSLRLLFDTGLTLAAVPFIQVVAFAVVYWSGRRPVRFAPAVDAYFAGSGPWYLALAVAGLFGAIASPVVSAQWFSRVGIACALAALAASVWIDFRFFKYALARAAGRAALDVILQRAVGWPATVLYFLMASAPKAGSLLPEVAANVFGTRP